jgi:serine/threonine protein phosphatase PrpC
MSSVSTLEALAISLASQCDRGKVREENQDTVRHTCARLGDLLIVADGVGSDAGGRRASQIAADTISSSVEGMPEFFPPEIAVEEAICHANAAIVAAAADPDYGDSRMGTAVVVALLRTDTDHAHAPLHAIIGNVGDSRAYLIHNQKLALLTREGSAGQDLHDSNLTTPQEVEAHPAASMLTQYLGKELNVRVEMRDVPLEVGDTLLLCSDGLWGCVSEQEIERELADGTRTVEEASRALLNRALDAGGHDNVAIEIARLTHCSETAAAAECAVEPRSEIPQEIEAVCEFAQGPDTLQSDRPISQLIVQRVASVAGLPLPPKRKKVFSLIRDLGRRISDKDSMTEKPVIAMPAAPSAAEVQPIVSWATLEPIVYGARLSSAQLSATASVQGRFLYTPGPGYVLPAGTHTLWVTFYAADSQESNPVLAAASITVLKATPSIHWPTPSRLPPGVALSAAQLNASATVAGTLEYSPAVGEVLADGTHTLSVTFTPEDKANYTSARATVSVTVAKSVPHIKWESPDPIPCGTPIGPAQLNASASVSGMFEYSPAAGEMLSAGSHTLSAIFTPSDGTSYSRAEAAVPLTVTRATPAIVWSTPGKVPYGTLLNDSMLNATASVPGTFVYTPGPGTLLSAGEHTPSVIFTPLNLSDYTPAQAAISLSVISETPAISWPVPDPIKSVTPLGPAQLNASAPVPGTFIYNPAAGETLRPGVRTLFVSFVPADSVNYTRAEANVSLTVTELAPAEVTWQNPPAISYGTALSDEQLNASSSIPGSFIYAPAAGEVLPAGKHKLAVIFTPEDQETYAKVLANVSLIVEKLPTVASSLRTTSQTPPGRGVAGQPAAARGAELGIIRRDEQPIQDLQRETRIYRGAVYAKGDDGQWHLQHT